MSQIIIIYNPDQTFSVVHPINQEKTIQEIYDRTVKASPELANLPYEFIDSSTLPADRKTRAGWRSTGVGQTITVNAIIPECFNADKCKKDLLVVFSTDIKLYAPIWSVISDMLTAKNFIALKQLADSLLKDGTITLPVLNAFKQVLLENHIDLDSYKKEAISAIPS